MNPYDSAARFMPRNYAPADTVTFKIHDEMRGAPVSPNVRAWAVSNLPDGDYVCQYWIHYDRWHFGRVEDVGERRRIIQLEQTYP